MHGEKFAAIQNIVLDEHNDLAAVFEKMRNKQKRDKMEKTKSIIPKVELQDDASVKEVSDEKLIKEVEAIGVKSFPLYDK